MHPRDDPDFPPTLAAADLAPSYAHIFRWGHDWADRLSASAQKVWLEPGEMTFLVLALSSSLAAQRTRLFDDIAALDAVSGRRLQVVPLGFVGPDSPPDEWSISACLTDVADALGLSRVPEGVLAVISGKPVTDGVDFDLVAAFRLTKAVPPDALHAIVLDALRERDHRDVADVLSRRISSALGIAGATQIIAVLSDIARRLREIAGS